MHFSTKSYLKNTRNYTAKHTQSSHLFLCIIERKQVQKEIMFARYKPLNYVKV